MVTTTFFCFVLVFISLQAIHLTADIHQGVGVQTATKGKKFETSQSILIDVNKRTIVEVPVRIRVETEIYGGRKMKLERLRTQEAPRLEATKISGAAHSVGSCEGTPNGKCEFTKRITSPIKEAFRYKLLVSDTRRSVSMLSSEKQLDKVYPNLKSQKLHAASNEVDNLMNRDYNGDGKGQRKPPIHNAKPLRQVHNLP